MYEQKIIVNRKSNDLTRKKNQIIVKNCQFGKQNKIY